MLVARVVGDDDLRLAIDVSCIAEKTVLLAQQNQNMRGSPKNPIGMVDSSSSKGLLFNPLILR